MDFLCLEYLNSDWGDHLGGRRRDRFHDERWREQFLTQWGLRVDHSPSESVFAAMTRMRLLLWRIVDALVAGERPAEADLAELNQFLEREPGYRQIVAAPFGSRLTFTPLVRDWDSVLGEVASSCANLLALHDPFRVRLCGNPNCRWVFYDESKNRTKRWCGDTCASLLKVREHRARKRRAETAS